MIPQYSKLKFQLPKLNTVWKKAQYRNAVNPDAPPPTPRVIEPPALIRRHPRGTGKWPLNSGWSLIRDEPLKNFGGGGGGGRVKYHKNITAREH